MRKSRFVRPAQVRETEKASIKEALWFDLRVAETSDDASLSEWRVAALDHFALLTGVTHLLITVTCTFLAFSHSYTDWTDNPLIAAGLILGVDAVAIGALLARNRFGIAPHRIVRGLCLYLIVTGVLWTWFGYAVADDVFITEIAAAPVAMSAGIAVGAIVTINSPPLALTSMIMSAFAAIVLAGSPLITAGVEIMSLVLVAYSIAGARTLEVRAPKEES